MGEEEDGKITEEDSQLGNFSLKGLSCTLSKVFDVGCKTLQGFGAGKPEDANSAST